jgi:hypothetical protein
VVLYLALGKLKFPDLFADVADLRKQSAGRGGCARSMARIACHSTSGNRPGPRHRHSPVGELRAAVDRWATRQDKPARSEAIRRLVELGLKVKQQK